MKIQAVRGMQDLLPGRKEIYRHIEDVVRRVLASYGYQEVGLPVLESTQLFKRAVGEATDIVEKEMYTFDDRNGESLTLRPEGTAGLARLAIENGLTYNQVQRLWYVSPMFRYERPQKGRYRQFDQIGAECLGTATPDIDAEMLLMNARMWEELGLSGDITLELNSIGSLPAREAYKQALVNYLGSFEAALDEDSKRRLTTNPLRILDSKVPQTREILEKAPLMSQFLDDESKADFDAVRQILDKRQQPYRINPQLVRGLDYYNKTVFEWVTDTLGAQGAVCSGGRYDGLAEQIGGKPSAGVGFAMGLDRLALMLEADFEPAAVADVYIASIGDAARDHALLFAEKLRQTLNLRIVVHCGDGKFKAQLKKADASGAQVALIIGEDELSRGEATIKPLRDNAEQLSMNDDQVGDYLAEFFSKE